MGLWIPCSRQEAEGALDLPDLPHWTSQTVCDAYQGASLTLLAAAPAKQYHLRDLHKVMKATDRSISMDNALQLAGSTQPSISSFTTTATPKEFNYEVLKGLTLELFTTEPVPFSLIDAKDFSSYLSTYNHCSLIVYLQDLRSVGILDQHTIRLLLKWSRNCTVLPHASTYPSTCGPRQADD